MQKLARQLIDVFFFGINFNHFYIFFIIILQNFSRLKKLKPFRIFHFITGNLELNDSCELTEECLRSFSVCLDRKCKCVNGYSAFDSKICLKGLCFL